MAKKKAAKKRPAKRAAKVKATRAQSSKKTTKKKASKKKTASKAKPVKVVVAPRTGSIDPGFTPGFDDGAFEFVGEVEALAETERERSAREKAERQAAVAKKRAQQEERDARRARNDAKARPAEAAAETKEPRPATVTPISQARDAAEVSLDIPVALLDDLRDEKETMDQLEAARRAKGSGPFKAEIQDLNARMSAHLKQTPVSRAQTKAGTRYIEAANAVVAFAEDERPDMSFARIDDENGKVFCKPDKKGRGERFSIPG